MISLNHMFLSNPYAGAFGLDIGDLSLKLVQLRRPTFSRERVFIVEHLRSVGLPPGLIVNGEIEQPELVRKKLLQLLGKEGNLFRPLKTRWVVADLPEPKTFLKLITIETPPEELIDDDILYQAKKHLPFELEETYLDWQVVPQSTREAGSHVLLGAVPKVISDAYTYLLESVDLSPIALEIEALPITRAMITREKKYEGEARVLLDLGATRSSLIFYDHDTIQFSTNIDFSGELVTTAISQQLKVDYATAEKLKISNGFTHDRERPDYLIALSPLAELLVLQIKKTLSFYKEHFPDGNLITHITLCGGMAQCKNLDTILSNKLKIESRAGNVWKNLFLKQSPTIAQWEGVSLASALGLAMRAAENPLHD